MRVFRVFVKRRAVGVIEATTWYEALGKAHSQFGRDADVWIQYA